MKRSFILKSVVIACLLLLQLGAAAQVNISIQILPPYPTKFTDYASKPHLMVIMLTNTSTVPQRIQLRGAITGDNGIEIRSKAGSRSSTPIELAAGETKSLNGSDIAKVIDYTKLDYAGITQNEFLTKGGLPEGRYQLCARAYNYDNNQPVSADEPVGCSNVFTISSLEPPMILSPMADQQISSGPGQVFSIRWNTPVSAPPGTKYRIRMVEMLGNRNPNDALMTATQPYFFEKEVNSNIYVYNPADPQLTPGRKYALMVEAFDPFGAAVFRNQGRSEVISFEYGVTEQVIAAIDEEEVAEPEKEIEMPKAPVIVRGTLKYRFPESPESGLFTLKNTQVYLEKVSMAGKSKIAYLRDTDPLDGVMANTDENGNFELKVGMSALDTAAGARYRLRVANPHYKPYDELLRIAPGDTIKLQQLVVDANSYQLNVNVAESFNGVKGKYVPGATIKIYRLKSDKLNTGLGIPFFEGDLLDSVKNWKEVAGKVLIASAITPGANEPNNGSGGAAYTVGFKRLFRNLGQPGYHYLVSLEKGEQVLAQRSFDDLEKIRKGAASNVVQQGANEPAQDVVRDFAYNQQANTTELTLLKELTASPRSKVTGVLKYGFKYYSGVPAQPYANMKVSLRSSKDLKSVVATAVTDSEGRFVFDFENVDSTYQGRAIRQGGRTVGMDKHVYFVVPEVKYYAVPNTEVLVQPWGDYDCGELVSMVRTYSVKINAEGVDKEAVPEAEVLVLRYSPETFKNQLPNLPEMNTNQEISFGNGDALSNNYRIAGSNTGSLIAMQIVGQSESNTNNFTLLRKLYTESDGSSVTIKGLIPSTDINKDRYQIRVGSADRLSNSVAYQTEIIHFPYTIPPRPQPGIDVVDKNNLTAEGRLKNLRDQRYDPSWGYRETVTHDPGGALITRGYDMGILQNSVSGVVGVSVNGPQVKAMGGVRLGYSANGHSSWFESSDWRSLANSLPSAKVKASSVVIEEPNLFNTVGLLLSDTAIIFNSQLPATETVFDEKVAVAKKGWRIAGRALDAFTKLGVKNMTAYVCQSGIQYGKKVYYNFGHVKANDNGDFVLTASILYQQSTGFKADQNTALKLVAPGYEEMIIDLGQITDGKQYYNEQINLEPLGNGLYGYVVSAQEQRIGVPARIKMVDNGKWVNTVAYSGDKHKESMNSGQGLDMSEQVRDMQRFSIDLPATKVKLVVMPYNRAYMTDTIEVDLPRGDQFIGMIPLTYRTHKMRIRVRHQNDELVPALVTLVETGSQDTIMQTSGSIQQSTAYFNFVNNATKNFTIHVKPLSNTPMPGKKLFAPRTFTIENVDNGIEKPYELEVFPGRAITGKVAFETGEKVAGAKVYMESGWGEATDNFSISDSDGNYSIVLPQVGISEYKLRANHYEEGKTYVSAEKLVKPQESKADLLIKIVKDIDISRLLGFKTKITAVNSQGDGVYQVSGELYDIPMNGNFGITDSILNRNLSFSNVLVKASAIKNSEGVPLAVPIENITTDNQELSVSVNNAFNGILHGAEGQIMLMKGSSDTTGTINGKVRILDNSFQFPSSYMRMQDTDFYLGIQTAAETMPVFASVQRANLAEQFMLTNKQGKAISFKYLGFNGVADIQGARTSNLKAQTIHLYMNLSTVLPGNIPLTLKAGEARISKGGIGRIVTTDTLSFGLDDWTVKANKPRMNMVVYNTETGESSEIDNSTWTLSPSSGGLVIKSGEILTKKLNIPFKDMTIIPGEEGLAGDLICPDLIDNKSLQNLDLNIGGIAKLKIQQGSQVSFIYDRGVGRDGSGHYKLSVTSPNYNGYAASFAGLDGMSDPAQSFKIQMISLLSNGEELFGFVNNQSITYYNQVKFMPATLSSTSQNSFSIAGNLDLGVPSLNTDFYDRLVYSKNGTGNKVTMPVLDFSFTGPGGVKFTSIAKKEAQQFRPEGFVVAGNMELPGGVNLKGGKLISMVTSAAGAALQREVDVLFGAREKVEQYFEDTKQELEARVKQAKDDLLKVAEDAVKDEVTKLIPLGTDEAKGALGEVAGAWKLGQGAADALRDGDYMRLAGMMKNIPGVDEAIQEAKNAVLMEAKNALTATQEALPKFKDLPVGNEGFKGGEFEFDLKNGRIFGNIKFALIPLGPVILRDGEMEMLFDRQGWYFCSGATMEIPVPLLSPLKVGVLIGNYGAISDELEARVTQIAQSQSKRLPPAVKSGLSGFFIVGAKPIADVDVSYGIPGIAQFKLVASVGAEVRTYALFGKGSFTLGMGALAYGRVYSSTSALGVSVSGGAEVNVAIASSAKFANGNVGICAQGCVSVEFFVEACVLGGCGSLNASIMAMLNLGIGDNGILRTTGCGGNGVDFSISTGSGSCINNPNFDF